MSPTETEIEKKARKYPEEVLNRGDLDVIDEVFADHHVSHSNAVHEPMDLDGLKGFAPMARTASQDLEVAVKDGTAEDDRMVRRSRLR